MWYCFDMNIRSQIVSEIQKINPFDDVEKKHIADAIAWIESGVEIFRIQKPATPPKHLVSYCVVVDTIKKAILMCDHKKSGLWLPIGGHVEVGEHPKDAVVREVAEELQIPTEFVFDAPVFVTVTQTVGSTAGHTDVSLWHVVRGEVGMNVVFEEDAFHGVKWFGFDKIPFEKSDVHMKRFVNKLKNILV